MTARAELVRLAAVADAQGRPKIAAVCHAALSYIDQLEAEVRRVRGNAAKGARTRLQRLTPAQRTAIAKAAAARRWGNRSFLPPHA